jgi:hypothetical protein
MQERRMILLKIGAPLSGLPIAAQVEMMDRIETQRQPKPAPRSINCDARNRP